MDRRTFLKLSGATVAVAALPIKIPRLPRIINVKEFPYFAKGDGITDDSVVLQMAVKDMISGDKLYFPKGVYNVTRLKFK